MGFYKCALPLMWVAVLGCGTDPAFTLTDAATQGGILKPPSRSAEKDSSLDQRQSPESQQTSEGASGPEALGGGGSGSGAPSKSSLTSKEMSHQKIPGGTSGVQDSASVGSESGQAMAVEISTSQEGQVSTSGEMPPGSDDKSKGEASAEASDPNFNREKSRCAANLGLKDASRIHLVNSQSQVTLTRPGDAILVKLSGNRTSLDLNIASVGSHGEEGGQKLAGVCVVLRGNQSKISVKVNAIMGAIDIDARGNMSRAHIEIAANASVQSIRADLGGNDARVEIVDQSSAGCQQVEAQNGVRCTASAND